MGRDTSIYKLDKGKARQFLYPDLFANINNKESFGNFVLNNYADLEDYDIDYNAIIHKVGSDINSILPDELWVILAWVQQLVEDKKIEDIHQTLEAIDQSYKYYGIDELFEADRSNAYAFMRQYANYTDHFKIVEIGHSLYDQGCNISSVDFIGFLDYMMLLMEKLIIADLWDNEYNFSSEQLKELNSIKATYAGTPLLFEIVDSGFEYLKGEWEEYEKDEEYLGKVSPEVQTVFMDNYFFHSCLEMKKAIEIENTNIVIIDSI